MQELPAVTVTRRGEDRLAAGHLWIYSSDVAARGDAPPGAVVRVLNPRGRPLGVAHFSSTSQITLRLLAHENAIVDRIFYLSRLRAALSLRERVARDTTAYRLVHAEGDLLPGLVIDRYGDYVVAQFLDQGMDAARDIIVDCLRELVAPKGVLARNDASVRKLEDLPQENAVVDGEIPERVEVSFNGLRWQADLLRGQKTGVYLDQRENYVAAARHAHGRALDCFTSTGGFALHLAASCQSVEGVDSSAHAIASAEANRDLNGIANVTFKEADVFDLLSGYARASRRFETVVLDPPALAKNRASVEAALRAYKELNYKALRLLDPGGILVTCSCSYHVSEADLLGAVASAALDAGRTLRVLERRAQASDHPILLTVPETLYLKCFVLEVL